MGTNELVEKILADGKERAVAIAAERDKAVAETRNRSADEVAGIEADFAERSKRECEAVLERARSRARMEKRNAVLAARWGMLDSAVQRAQEKFLADSGYADFMTKLVKDHAGSSSVVSMSEADARSFGARLGTKLGDPLPLAGGVMIRTGKVGLNFSLGIALSELRDELARELSQILFES